MYFLPVTCKFGLVPYDFKLAWNLTCKFWWLALIVIFNSEPDGHIDKRTDSLVGGEGCSRDRLYEQMDRQMENWTDWQMHSQTNEHATNRHRHE